MINKYSALLAALLLTSNAHAAIDLIARGSLSGSASDLSGLSAPLENGVAGNLLGGIGSGLAWAGGNTFLALPDRGPNATPWTGGGTLDNTSSYVARFQTLSLNLTASSGGALPFDLTPTLQNTTLLYSNTALNYGAATAAYGSGAPSINTASQFYFSGRSDNFGAGTSLNPNNARLDPEGIRVSNDGKKVYLSDEYGPYVYQFDRATGARTNVFTLPSNLAVSNLSSQGSLEISGNTSGRVANKGLEGLAITPDGTKLVGFVQSPLLQDGGDGKSANRIVTIDIATGATHEYAYNNTVGGKNFNSSEILALNDHEFLVLERDGKGLGDDSNAAFKRIYKVDLSGAADVSGISGEAALNAVAPSKSLFLDIRAVLNAHGVTDDQIPAKLEGLAFGEDIDIGGIKYHTLYLGNDNDFIGTTPLGRSNPNQWFVFAFTDGDLAGISPNSIFANQAIAAVPEADTYVMMLVGLALVGGVARRRGLI